MSTTLKELCARFAATWSRNVFVVTGEPERICQNEAELAVIIGSAALTAVEALDPGCAARRAAATYKLAYRGYIIKVKQDFGRDFFLIDGMPCMWGYVVIYGDGERYPGCNAMPGATWFQTVKDAKRAIDILIEVGGEENHADFWERMHAIKKGESGNG